MMTVDYDSFAQASTLIHTLQGAALLLLGAAEVHAFKNPGHRMELIGPLALMLAGLLGLVVILALPGGWQLRALAAALAARSGFHLFIAFSCLFAAAGLSRLMQHVAGAGGRRWQSVFLILLAAIGVLYFMLAWRVNVEAMRAVLLRHAAIGGALLLAVLAKALHTWSGRRVLQTCWAILLIAASVQLLAYRETGATFGRHMVTLTIGPGQPAAQTAPVSPAIKTKNAVPAPKKRSGN